MAKPLAPHRGPPECDSCGGEGEYPADEPGYVYDCEDCDCTGLVEWATFVPDEEPDVCDRCADAGDQTPKPVDCDGCSPLCAACFAAMHDAVCGCRMPVATFDQIAESFGPHHTPELADMPAWDDPRLGDHLRDTLNEVARGR